MPLNPDSHQSSFALAEPALRQNPGPASAASPIFEAALDLVPLLEQGQPLTSAHLRDAMTAAFGASDAEGAWLWKDAYEAAEAAQVLFLRRHLPAMRARAADPAQLLAMLARLAALIPTHTRRSEESQAYQQFSTPIDLAFCAAAAAAITGHDTVLEPSAGTGLLAVFAPVREKRLILNELAPVRADLLAGLFPDAALFRANAENIHDYLPRVLKPTVVLMNPPFSAAANISRSVQGTDLKHVRAALQRLAPGGRLVAITSAGAFPSSQEAPGFLADVGTIRLSALLDGTFFKRHGTAIETRLTVIDRVCDGAAPVFTQASSPAALLELIFQCLAPRADLSSSDDAPAPELALFDRPSVKRSPAVPSSATPSNDTPCEPLSYEITPADDQTGAKISDALYEPYRVETIRIKGAKPHPTQLVQSAAMSSVRLPAPTYQPHVPSPLIEDGVLSDAQIESIIYAGEAHAQHLSGRWTVNESFDVISPANEDDANAVRYRRGWSLGDGTGAGKGRQVAGIILDNWMKGRRRALWISKSDKLLEDAQRDWSALGREKLQIVPLDRFPQGRTITLPEGILFTTYATLRQPERNGKASRVSQIIEWLGRDFDGVIVFDEAHAMANAAGFTSERGDQAPSQQGLAGLRLQYACHGARVVYASATGATDIQNLAYAQRLGFWGGDDFPFPTRAAFVAAIENGGIAAMEVVARDAKALGLYTARSLSYEGVEVAMLDHPLTPAQIAIYDSYADAFQVIHNNLDAALDAANVTSEDGTLNRQAKAAAKSAFESNKQRFFNFLITAMKMPTLIASIESDLARGEAPIIQLVSTSEALMDRRLALIPVEEWNDLSVDITPREYVLDYLMHGFPVQLYETYSDAEGNLLSRPVIKDGQPVTSREAENCRDAMIEHLASLPPVPCALDQLVQHFGTEAVAEVTGRSRRIVRKTKLGQSVLAVENRPASASLAEAQAFMDDKKNILVFSNAGGTGRSYHADLAAKNQRKRIHYLLEAGWQADNAIQGLGRSNRTNQAQPPLFRPVTTDIRSEKRFLSTIARRLDSLGAITRGQRQTGGQGMFRAEDNLETSYARQALRQLYVDIFAGRVKACTLFRFESMTGLSLTDKQGSLLDELPPITTFLNRVLALQIAVQNALFAHFEGLHSDIIAGAVKAGTFEIGVETIRAENLTILSRTSVATHKATGAETLVFEVERKDRRRYLSLDDVKAMAAKARQPVLLINIQSGRAALSVPAPSVMLEDGNSEPCVTLRRPTEALTLTKGELKASKWREADDALFSKAWADELASLPEFRTTQFHVLTGLMLPVWDRLRDENPRIYRFQTDAGERVIGRLIETGALSALGLAASAMPPDQAVAHILEGGTVSLAGGHSLRTCSVMHARRIELTGFDADAVPALKALGLISEIIAWKLRLFVPTGEQAAPILTRLLERFPTAAEAQRAA